MCAENMLAVEVLIVSMYSFNHGYRLAIFSFQLFLLPFSSSADPHPPTDGKLLTGPSRQQPAQFSRCVDACEGCRARQERSRVKSAGGTDEKERITERERKAEGERPVVSGQSTQGAGRGWHLGLAHAIRISSTAIIQPHKDFTMGPLRQYPYSQYPYSQYHPSQCLSSRPASPL